MLNMWMEWLILIQSYICTVIRYSRECKVETEDVKSNSSKSIEVESFVQIPPEFLAAASGGGVEP